MARSKIRKIKDFTVLAITMVAIGVITLIATINTSEVIFRRDTPLSDVIINVDLTDDALANRELITQESKSYEKGSFGIPKKIKFPESKTHYDIVDSRVENGEWKATKGIAHTFITEEPIQKVFGEAVIYIRTNTPTTQNIGDIMSGDLINIVTTEGWQLGYKVKDARVNIPELSAKTRSASTIVKSHPKRDFRNTFANSSVAVSGLSA
ncbi:hypothetical protein IPL85_04595 [Candidatus Saccharibacteria bacterium]|nr:MAG: hypothetical protein IPL85_04595 [Candidatus Saccharibacteria bacterium]